MLRRKMTLGSAAIACLFAAVNLGCGGGGGTTNAPTASAPAGDAAEAQPAGDTADAETFPGEPASAAAASGDAEEGWGHLTGRFVYDGEAPRQQQLSVTKDQEFCNKQPPLDESLVVNSANGGVRDVVVWLYLGRGDEAPEPHPSYADTAEAEVRLDNEWCRFEPHVQLLRTSQTLVVGNKDDIGHNTKCDTFNNPAFNLTVPIGQEITQKFEQSERLPATVGCNIHPWMTAHLLIQDHPYMAASDDDGNFEIKNLPSGNWTFQVWHMKSGYVDEVSLGGKETEWRRGRVELEIKSGDNDLGEIKLQPALLNK